MFPTPRRRLPYSRELLVRARWWFQYYVTVLWPMLCMELLQLLLLQLPLLLQHVKASAPISTVPRQWSMLFLVVT